MTRKEIYDALDLPHMKAAYLLGALVYDDATDYGERLLTVEAAEGLTATEQNALNVFVLEQVAAEPGVLPEKWAAAIHSIGVVLDRRIKLKPSAGGNECPGNGEHDGIECQCDECDYMMICYPPDEPAHDRLRWIR